MDSVRAKASGLGSILTSGWTWLAGGAATAGLAAFLTTAARADADLDALMRALTAVAGSTAEAKRQFDELNKLAVRSPVLDLSSAIMSAVQLQSTGDFGFEETKGIMATISNAVAFGGGGNDAYQRVLINLQQIASQGKLTGDELRETAAFIPGFRKALADAFPHGTEGLSGVEVIRGVVAELQKIPEVGGGVRTSFDNMSSAIKRGMAAVGAVVNSILVPAFDKVSGALNRLVDSGILDRIGKGLTSAFDGGKLAGAMLTGLSVILATLEKAPEVGRRVGRSLSNAFDQVSQRLGILGAILGAIFFSGTIGRIVAGVFTLIRAMIALVGAIRAVGIAQVVTNAIATRGASVLRDLFIAGVAAAAGYAALTTIFERLIPGGLNAAAEGLGISEIFERATQIKDEMMGLSGGGGPDESAGTGPVVDSIKKQTEYARQTAENTKALRDQIQDMILGGGAATKAAFNSRNLNSWTGSTGNTKVNQAVRMLHEAFMEDVFKQLGTMSRHSAFAPKGM